MNVSTRSRSPVWIPYLWPLLPALLAVPSWAAPQQATAQEMHVLQRVGFGPSLADLGDLRTQGLPGWIEFNLTGMGTGTGSQPNPRLDLLLQPYVDPELEYYDSNTLEDLRRRELAYGLYGDRPLVEQMVSFWHNHFSTDYTKIQGEFKREVSVVPNFPVGGRYATYFLRRDMDFYRQHGLGRFEDLLLHSARSLTMMFYLDTATSDSDTPNQNYARELMELHTLGVGQLYTEADVLEASKLFTGWGFSLIMGEPGPQDPDDVPLPLAGPEVLARLRSGDINADFVIDGIDEQLMLDLIDVAPPCGDFSCGDLNQDGATDEDDLAILLANKGRIFWLEHSFDESDYSPGDELTEEKSFFGGELVIPDGQTTKSRYAETITFLRYLAGREETARHISAKLIAKFVANVPAVPGYELPTSNSSGWPQELNQLREDCVATWMASDGQIEEVLRTIFTSQAFLSSTAYRWEKPATPLETTMRAIRAFEGSSRAVGLVDSQSELTRLREAVVQQGRYELFNERLPTGNSENEEVSSASLISGFHLRSEVCSEGSDFEPNWAGLFPGQSGHAVDLPDTVLDLLYGVGGYTNFDRTFARQWHQDLIDAGTPDDLTQVCSALVPFLASFPQNFLQ